MTFDIAPCGDDALLIMTGHIRERHQLAAALRKSGSWLNCVTGKADVIVQFDPLRMLPAEAYEKLKSECSSTNLNVTSSATHCLKMFTGADSRFDLSELSQSLGLSEREFLRMFSAQTYTVDMLGFMPGFAYLDGLCPDWKIERLATPRKRVPAGAVGVISGQCGLYSLSGPGGWPIIGLIQTALFDPTNEQSPMLLKPGDRIKFEVVCH